MSLGFTILLLLLLRFQLYLWGSQLFFFLCVPSFVSGVHNFSSSASQDLSLGFAILLLRPKSNLWGSPLFFFCGTSFISGVHHSSSSAVPALSLGFNHCSSSAVPALSLGFTILLLLRYQLYLWGSPFFFFCGTSFISGVHHSSSSAVPALSLGFTILLLLRSQLYLWGSQFFFFLCVPSFISGVHHSSSSPVVVNLCFILCLFFIY